MRDFSYMKTITDPNFEKISLKQYIKNMKLDSKLTDEETLNALMTEYNKVIIPQRATEYSAGYDLRTPYFIEVPPHKTVIVHTGIKAKMPAHIVLKLYVRSSIAFKRDSALKNQVGIIDADYYNNPKNDGEILICLENRGDTIVEFEAGERIAQGIFDKYYITKDDKPLSQDRVGGLGSTQRN